MKIVFALVCLLGVCLTLKMQAHSQSLPNTLKADQSPEAQAANMRLLTFIINDNSLSKALTSGEQPDQQQLSKLVDFMINDPYFQVQLIKSVSSRQGNQWIGELSKQAQIRFMKIITSIPLSQYSNSKKMNKVMKQLTEDSQIGPALTKQFGQDLDSKVITKSGSSVRPAVHAHLMVIADDI